MGERPRVLQIATLDTKEVETRFIKKCLEDNGLDVYLLDASIRRTVDGGAHITPDQIAAAVGTTMPEIRALNHEGKCLALMIQGAIACAHELDERVGFSGIIGAGGSAGTTLGAAVMRTFPFGLPKVLISTMASGMTKPFVGTKDIVMLNSICDVSGLNTVTRRVFENGALALAGMAHGYKPVVPSGKPLVTITTLATTDKCCNRVREALEQRGCEVMVFHTQGTGGAAMDEIVRDQDVSLVVDLSLIEVGQLPGPGSVRRRARQVQGRSGEGRSDHLCAGQHRLSGRWSHRGRQGAIPRQALSHPQRLGHRGPGRRRRLQTCCRAYGRTHQGGQGPRCLLRPAAWLLISRQRTGPSVRAVTATGLCRALEEGDARGRARGRPALSHQRRSNSPMRSSSRP